LCSLACKLFMMIGIRYEEVDVTSFKNIGFEALTKIASLAVCRSFSFSTTAMMLFEQAIEIPNSYPWLIAQRKIAHKNCVHSSSSHVARNQRRKKRDFHSFSILSLCSLFADSIVSKSLLKFKSAEKCNVQQVKEGK
jgi:hypothetical protein